MRSEKEPIALLAASPHPTFTKRNGKRACTLFHRHFCLVVKSDWMWKCWLLNCPIHPAVKWDLFPVAAIKWRPSLRVRVAWTGKNDVMRRRVDAETFWKRKEKFAFSNLSGYVRTGPYHKAAHKAPSTRIEIDLKTQTFLCGLAFRPHVSDEYAYRKRKLLKTLSSGKLLKTQTSGYVWTGKSELFENADVMAAVLNKNTCIIVIYS